MTPERKTPGEKVASRLASRADRPGLNRRSMPGGGEVFTGPLASRALKALGARAMTVDQSIVVPESFDPSKPESQALYAHEKVHLEGSGGRGSHEVRDAEEVAARAAERMVLHRATTEVAYEEGRGPGAAAGAGNAGDAADKGGRGLTSPPGDGSERPEAKDHRPAPEKGYAALRKQGLSHHDVVDRLAKEYLDNLEDQMTADTGREIESKLGY